jgi:hypothetical protein
MLKKKSKCQQLLKRNKIANMRSLMLKRKILIKSRKILLNRIGTKLRMKKMRMTRMMKTTKSEKDNYHRRINNNKRRLIKRRTMMKNKMMLYLKIKKKRTSKRLKLMIDTKNLPQDINRTKVDMKEVVIEETEAIIEAAMLTDTKKVAEEATILIIEAAEEENMEVMIENTNIRLKLKIHLILRMSFTGRSTKLISLKISLNILVSSEIITEETEEISVVVVVATMKDMEMPFIEISNSFVINIFIETMITEDKIITTKTSRKTL